MATRGFNGTILVDAYGAYTHLAAPKRPGCCLLQHLGATDELCNCAPLLEVDMADSAQIRCVTKSDSQKPWERFTCIGGVNMDGSEWKVTQDWIIDGIESGGWKFTVAVDGRRVPVIVAESSTGHKYIKAETDGEQPDSLLCLPEFPWHWRYSKHEY